MTSLLQQLQAGIRAGAALAAGCVASAACSASELSTLPELSDASQSDANSQDASQADAHTPDAGGLLPYPLDVLGFHPDTSCELLPVCYVNGDHRACLAVDDPSLPVAVFSYVDYCEASGPWAANPADTIYAPEGDCCYISASFLLPTPGRPLSVGHVTLCAPPIERADWLAT